jgi:hypothetical protein
MSRDAPPNPGEAAGENLGAGHDDAEGGWLDAEVRDSFPASDPLSHWAGPVRPIDEADRARHFPSPGTTSRATGRRGA